MGVWNQILNQAIDTVDMQYQYKCVGRYFPTNKFITKFMGEVIVEFDEVHAMDNVWIGWIRAALNLHGNRKYESEMPNYSGQFLPFARHRHHHTGHTDSVHNEQDTSGFLVNATG